MLHAQALEWCKNEFLSGNVLTERAQDALTEIFKRFDVKHNDELSTDQIKELSMVLNTTGQLLSRQDENEIGQRVVLRLERFLDFFCSRVKADPLGVQMFLERMGYTLGLVRKEGTFFRAREGKKGLPFQSKRERRHAITRSMNRSRRHLKESIRDKQAKDPAMNIWKWVEIKRGITARRPKTASSVVLSLQKAKLNKNGGPRPLSTGGGTSRRRRNSGQRCPPT